MNIKKGDVLKAKIGLAERTVLGVADDIYFLSLDSKENGLGEFFYTLEGLKETFELPEEKWVPKEGEMVYRIEDFMTILGADSYSQAFLDELTSIGNVFKTEEEAEAKLAEVLAVLKK